jgi:hypothetical protein
MFTRKFAVGVLSVIGLISALNVLPSNAMAYDVEYSNSSWMFVPKHKKCVQLSKKEFNDVFQNLQSGKYPFIGGVEVEIHPNKIEYAQFFVIKMAPTIGIYNTIAGSYDSCTWAHEEIISGRMEKRFR